MSYMLNYSRLSPLMGNMIYRPRSCPQLLASHGQPDVHLLNTRVSRCQMVPGPSVSNLDIPRLHPPKPPTPAPNHVHLLGVRISTCRPPSASQLDSVQRSLPYSAHTAWSWWMLCLILAMALPGLSPLGQTLAQFMMVWQRYSL